MTMQEHLINLKRKSAELQKTIADYESIMLKYPDASVEKDRWENIRISSNGVNGFAVDCEISHSCGCCSDAPLFAYPFLNTEFGKIYSKPERFCIGQADQYEGGDRQNDEWINEMNKVGMSQMVIDKVKKYFSEQKKESIENLENALERLKGEEVC